MNFYYKMTLCPDPTHFPNGLSDEILQKIIKYFSDKDEALLSTEHHQSGIVHYEGLFGVLKVLQVSHIKRLLFTLCGFPGRTQLSMEPNMKKHMIFVKNVHYLPGAISYVMKEGKGDLVKKGMSSTWIDEQLVEAKKNLALQDIENCIYVNDSTFNRLVTTFVIENNESWSDLQNVINRMGITHDFARVRNGKAHCAHLLAKHLGDLTNMNELSMNWFPCGNIR